MIHVSLLIHIPYRRRSSFAQSRPVRHKATLIHYKTVEKKQIAMTLGILLMKLQPLAKQSLKKFTTSSWSWEREIVNHCIHKSELFVLKTYHWLPVNSELEPSKLELIKVVIDLCKTKQTQKTTTITTNTTTTTKQPSNVGKKLVF